MHKETLLIIFCFIKYITSQGQGLQWILLTDGTSGDTPAARRDAAMGYDSTFLIVFGGRGLTGLPLQDTSAFNLIQGGWEQLYFQNPPSNRYGMAYASPSSYTLNSGMYIFGGFGYQQSTFNNPYIGYGSGGSNQINYNYATPPNFIQNPSLMNNPNYVNNPNYNPMSGVANGDVFNDQNYQPVPDSWFLNFQSKQWQQLQTTPYERGFGSAAISPFGSMYLSSYSSQPRVVISMGKTRDWMYSNVDSIGIMQDMASLNPSYAHARYSHSTAMLTDNQMLLYGGCLSGYGKGGPCPSKDTWLMNIDNGHWERISDCPPTKMGAVMVAVPSYGTCASPYAGVFPNQNMGQEQTIAILWGGRESNPSSIAVRIIACLMVKETYPSPRDEVAVFSLSSKQWYMKKARPFQDGSYPLLREGAAFSAGCFQGMPASSQDALNAPVSRGCVYPFSYYHLHGIFQFFTYGVIFPFGYIVGRYAPDTAIRKPLHMILQIFGILLTICGFSFGVHSVRAPSWLHFKHPHAIIGIITFILTIIQFVMGLIGAVFIKKRHPENNRREESVKHVQEEPWQAETPWRLGHVGLGTLVLLLGLINISLGVFLAVLPMPVWIIWYIYLGLLVIILALLEIRRALTNLNKEGASYRTPGNKRSQINGGESYHSSYSEEPQLTKRSFNGRLPPSSGDRNLRRDKIPLLESESISRDPRQRPNDVTGSASLPQYNRPTERDYHPRQQQPHTRGKEVGLDYYVGYTPEHETAMPYVI
ncbi:unnamed protein product [Didymodactylos carnosus]|uniref:ascorbate ferrireductase (transmembrane) n=1 Tax=Didymodactylos carnosus TaxID=1234261 RepID=A0A813RFY6_9BILA|nr:unnamed protein product [Didymodactylos carnosus]CAF0807931.1 unnamed protein product [Didymodactylos carnosus]CAF3562804.1 unnamed protein product [Didymodactylos carnosus]CAF3591671.1 unnamed protein product [Didymodactylos carnosus]